MAILVLEASIAGGQFPTKDIARRTYMFRTLGLGITDFANMIMVMGIPYNSNNGRNICASLFSLLTGESYFVSSLMAKKIGAFEKYEINKTSMLRVIKNHAIASNVIDEELDNINYDLQYLNRDLTRNILGNDFDKAIHHAWTNAFQNGMKYGYRNAQVSVSAPTGSISFLLGATTTSIEPAFTHIMYKKLHGGGYMTVTNPNVNRALKNLGYKENEIKDIIEFMNDNYGNIEDAPHIKSSDIEIFDTANVNGNGKRYIKPDGHYKLVASITPMLSGACSKTTNLPKTATVEDVAKVYLDSWKLGVKCITVYVDGAKASQPMNNILEQDISKQELKDLTYPTLLEYAERAKEELNTLKPLQRIRPEGIRHGNTHKLIIDGVKLYITVNKDEDNNIVEVYVNTDKQGSVITGLLNSMSKMMSTMLQYGVPAKEISKSLRGANFSPNGFVQSHPNIKNTDSIVDAISKVVDIELGDYSRVQIKENRMPRYNSKGMIENLNSDNLLKSPSTKVSDKSSYQPTQEEIDNAEKVHEITCSICGGNHVVQIGVCHWCMDCQESSGCS